jgi:dienelactone hydrolase
MRNLQCLIALGVVFLFLALPGHAAQSESNRKVRVSVVNYQTEDGWAIQGDLYLPPTPSNHPIPAAILLSEPDWAERSIYDAYLGPDYARNGIAALAIDVRGTGKSRGDREFNSFTPQEVDQILLDIKGAVKFLSSQKNIDPKRISITGSGIGANYAVLGALQNPTAVQALVLMSGRFTQAAREYIAFRKDLPIFFIVGKHDKDSFKDMSEAYYISRDPSSEFVTGEDHGALMFTHTEGLKEQTAKWLVDNLTGLGTETPVSFQSEDGWTLYGTLRMPDKMGKPGKLPGVVLVHGARHDSEAFYYLSRDVAKEGMAVLTFDWRGKGKSFKTKGTRAPNADDFKVGGEEVEKVYLDVKAAINFLASQDHVDAQRIGSLGATLACAHAVRSAIGDSRVKTIVLLSCGAPSVDDAVKNYFKTNDVPILAVASADDTHWNRTDSASGSFAVDTKEFYLLSKSKSSQYILYDHGTHGSAMFNMDTELERKISHWFAEKLGAGTGPN